MFTDNKKQKIILYEYGIPNRVHGFINYSGGIYQSPISPGVIVVTDDNANTGYYTNQNAVIYNVQSITVDNMIYTKVLSIAALYTQDRSWYYDSVTTILYVRFANYDPPLSKEIYIGIVYGYSKGLSDPVFGDKYYEQRIESIFGVKKSKDPLFFGLLKFSSGSVKLINTDGALDNWGNLNLFRQPSKILIGEEGDTYSALKQVFTGIIGNYSYSWDSISIKNDDIRSNLTNPIPYNQYLVADYAQLNTSNVGKYKPIAYGDIRHGICICVDEMTTPAPLTYTFSFMDIEHYRPTSTDKIYVEEVDVTASAVVTLATATFTLPAATVDGKFSDVTITFRGADLDNGVEIIKDIMLKYADVSYIASNYDLTEVAAAVTVAGARNTSLYAHEKQALNKAIEQLCIDIDGLFFAKDNGLYTVRIYSAIRTPVKTIYKYQWKSEPDITNDTDEFLSSVDIDYSKNQKSGDYITYTNTVYESGVIDLYHSTQSKTIKTGLTDSASADLKSEVIMSTSKQIKDIVTRSTTFEHYDLEIMDFVYADPKCRISGTESLSIWEVIGIDKNLDNWNIKLTLRYISEIPT